MIIHCIKIALILMHFLFGTFEPLKKHQNYNYMDFDFHLKRALRFLLAIIRQWIQINQGKLDLRMVIHWMIAWFIFYNDYWWLLITNIIVMQNIAQIKWSNTASGFWWGKYNFFLVLKKCLNSIKSISEPQLYSESKFERICLYLKE